jgi:acetolactate synthase regulatory subunit
MHAGEPPTLTVTLDLDRNPMDLERVLAMVRVRGYALLALDAEATRCTLTVRESEGSSGLLEHRLRRLCGVHVVAGSPSIQETAA